MNDRNPQFDLFLSYNRLDRKLIDPLAEALRERGLKVFKDDWYLRPGQPWPAALESNLAASRAVAVAVGRNGLGPWQQREAAAALDRQRRTPETEPSLPVIPVLLDEEGSRQTGLAFLLQNTWVDGRDPRAADLIAGPVHGKAPAELYDAAHPDPRARICPYRGLSVFREEDAGFYFGRGPDLERLAAAVDAHQLVAVIGASGSGKSSLARAGLIPLLRRQQGERVWQVADIVPGSNPFLALARALLPLREPERILTWSKGDIDEECERLQDHLVRKGADHLTHVVGQILEEPGTTRLLLLADQWEELYTYRPNEATAAQVHRERVRRFTRMLLGAVREGSLQVVLTLRADYWGEVLNDEPLAARLPDAALVHLRALDRTALQAVILRPAEITRLKVPDALAEVLLDAAEGQPGDLPLLEFTLQQLWAERTGDGGTLTLDAYRAMGGLEQAIVTRAERVYGELTPEERDAVPGVFAALVQVGEARTDLRRRARLCELGGSGQAVARRLAGERLLVTSRDWISGEELVEVAHEALLRHWPKLQEWIDARRGALLTVRQLQADSRIWLVRQKSPSYLWSHERVREAAEALSQLGSEVSLSDEEREFLGPVEPAAMLAELEQPETGHKRRALIGQRLDALGDPRGGVGVDADGTPQIAWCAVSSGEASIDVERRFPRGTKTLRKVVGDFHMARYLVTVAQYRAFLEADDGWRDPRWWGEDLYRDPEGDSYDFGRFGNYPAVYVSWLDALAFCRWIGERLKASVRLPDEWEWQQTATGGDADKVFPWGPDWDPKLEPFRANTFESRLGAATAVGMYPAGASSPAGVLDMAGTLWEWCLNKHNNPQVTQSGNRDFDDRVLRGGSWLCYQVGARSAYRRRSLPLSRLSLLGFRVLCSSPICDH